MGDRRRDSSLAYSGASTTTSVTKVFLQFEKITATTSVTLSCLALAVAALLGMLQVIARFLTDQALPWSEPTVRTLLIWMTYLGICGAARAGGLIAVDAVYSIVGNGMRRMMRLIILIMCAVFFCILAWFGIEMAIFVHRQILAGVGMSIAWAYAAIPTGAIFSLLSVVAHYLVAGHAGTDAEHSIARGAA